MKLRYMEVPLTDGTIAIVDPMEIAAVVGYRRTPSGCTIFLRGGASIVGVASLAQELYDDLQTRLVEMQQSGYLVERVRDASRRRPLDPTHAAV